MPSGIYVKSEEHKRKLSEALMGNIPWNKGKEGCYSQETRDKISRTLTGRRLTEEHKLNIGKANIGEKNSSYGVPVPLERRKRISQKVKTLWAEDAEYRNAIVSKRKGTKLTQEWKDNISKGHLKRFKTMTQEDVREHLQRSLWSREVNKNTDIELIMKDHFHKVGLYYEQQKPVGKWFVDFYLPELDWLIECNGEYWHSLPDRIKRDELLQNYCETNQLPLLWLWGKDIKEDPELAICKAFINYLTRGYIALTEESYDS